MRSNEGVGGPGYTGFLSSVAVPLHRSLGLTDGENERIEELLGRVPNDFELAVFSLLWSEHCGYKHSAPLLGRLPSSGERVLQGPGGNAGVIDLGGGLAVAFKAESHNHPSAVEPFQGAATGVGGILRDIVAMGARPVALLDGLRFGSPGWQFRQAVAGIAHYGNCVGVPTVGGECAFDAGYAPIRSSTRCASACCRPSACSARRRRAWETRSCSTARSPDATGSGAHPCSPRRISKAPTRSGRRSRSAIRFAARR